MILALIAFVFLAGYAILIFYYFRQWKRLQDYSAASMPSVPVSVIIAARNEEKTLPLLVQDLAGQQYPPGLFEVIIVNDYSTDQTAAVGKNLPANFRMVLPDWPQERSSKKKAITTGVARAKGELLVITDADCRVGENWVKTMASFYQETGAAFIAAPVKYVYRHSVLQVLQALDFITLQGITAASVSADAGTLCNGANLAYTKQAFDAVNGFEGIESVPTGDDMLLLYKIRKLNPAKVFYLKSNEAMVTTSPMQTWKAFFQQRRRWGSKTLLYDDRRLIVVLAFVLLLNLLPMAFLVAGLFQPLYILFLFFFLFGKALIEWPFVGSVAAFFGEKKLMRSFFFLQPLHVFYTVFVGIRSQVGSYEWKGRTASPPPRGEVSNTQSSLKQDAGNGTASSQSWGGASATPP